MAILQVRDVPDDLYENLTAIAKIENRSISQETIVLLKTALQHKTERVSHRKAILAEIDKLKYHDKLKSMPSPAELIREDRDR